jgi:tRNA dimethylallyltransferase
VHQLARGQPIVSGDRGRATAQIGIRKKGVSTMQRPILIAGPTASGKTALALALAARTGGVIINADSMQVYREIPILSAQPTLDEQAQAPHRLFGHVPAAEAYSTGRYLADIALALAAADAQAQTPIIVGGTGFYFKALLEGLSPVPPIPPVIRAHIRAFCQDLELRFGRYAVWQHLMSVDPAMASRLGVNDLQRITRALEVIEATGKSLNEWQFVDGKPVVDGALALKIVVARPRDELRARADRRFDQMLAAGGLDEVRSLAQLALSSELPAMRALGVQPLLAHLEGVLTLDAAVVQAKLETRQYIKRQETWLRRNMIAWRHVNAQQMENIDTLIDAII